MAYKIDSNVCIGCGACMGACPVEAISQNEEGKMVIDKNLCISCGTCYAVCPVEAPASEE